MKSSFTQVETVSKCEADMTTDKKQYVEVTINPASEMLFSSFVAGT